MVAREYRYGLAFLVEHFGGMIEQEALEQALEYARRFPEAIQTRIAENERVEKMLTSGTAG